MSVCTFYYIIVCKKMPDFAEERAKSGVPFIILPLFGRL
ncbi:hypothetical protein B4168_2352 [Anoxybacillus flavithermus]|nr:hypothetical protein B4168_2352 [Anoxybacillus flavithermus]OAO87777.1 hypothetical protein GT23_0924 [Parageobacillus thermoglucosidasius]